MWSKRDYFFLNLNSFEQNITHNSIPTPLIFNDKIRIFYSTRCSDGINRGIFSDFDLNLEKNINNYSLPILNIGPPGSFDSSGIMPSSVVFFDGLFYMYYIGWNKQVDVPYRLSIGLATSNDGERFQKVSVGPVLDRRIDEPYFNTAPCVMIDDNKIWRMWYVSCTGWSLKDGRQEPSYRIAYRESLDGINWSSNPTICIDYNYENGIESIGRPYVIKLKDRYIMSCSIRKITDYRNNKNNSYKISFYESNNGTNWISTNEFIEKNIVNWDDEMTCYGSLIYNNDKLFCIYNGNGFGKTGFRIAEKYLI